MNPKLAKMKFIVTAICLFAILTSGNSQSVYTRPYTISGNKFSLTAFKDENKNYFLEVKDNDQKVFGKKVKVGTAINRGMYKHYAVLLLSKAFEQTIKGGTSEEQENHPQFLDNYTEDAARYLFKNDTPHTVITVPLDEFYYLELYQDGNGDYTLSEKNTFDRNGGTLLVKLTYSTAEEFTCIEAGLKDQFILLNHLDKLQAVLQAVDARNKPSFFLVKNNDGYQLLLYPNPAKAETSGILLSPHTAEPFLKKEFQLPGGTKAFTIKSPSDH